jgi:hypothetical protein
MRGGTKNQADGRFDSGTGTSHEVNILAFFFVCTLIQLCSSTVRKLVVDGPYLLSVRDKKTNEYSTFRHWYLLGHTMNIPLININDTLSRAVTSWVSDFCMY